MPISSPEGDVLGLIEGKATLIHAAKCVGHSLCAEDCPVGAIEMKLGSPGRHAEMPLLDEHYQTSVPGIHIVGELGGIGLIKNAVLQGIRAMDFIASTPGKRNGDLDVLIVGAGPAGLAAALTAKKHGMRYRVIEQGDIGGTILQYPRRKIVMTSPVELPLYGRLKLHETSKEHLLEVWNRIISKSGIEIGTNQKALDIQKTNGSFTIKTNQDEYRAHRIVLALGRRGTPRKLGVRGEDLSKVSYRLLEAESYQNCKILVVGGGDSAIEAAIGLAAQNTNEVVLSYRKGEFSRIKERNAKHLQDFVKRGRIQVLYHSEVREITKESILLQTSEEVRDIANDYVFVFAGGELPYDFLRKTGIQFHSQNL